MEKEQVLAEAPFTRDEYQKILLYFQKTVFIPISE